MPYKIKKFEQRKIYYAHPLYVKENLKNTKTFISKTKAINWAEKQKNPTLVQEVREGFGSLEKIRRKQRGR